MGLRVVAEGIEDRPRWTCLRQFGCDLAQGYLICRPGPADRLPLAGERPHSARGSLTG